MFSNAQIRLKHLPTIQHLELKRLPDQHKYTQIIARVLLSLIIFLGLTAVGIMTDYGSFDILIIMPLCIGICAIFTIWPLLSHRFRGYALRQHDLVYQSGIVWRKTTAIAFNRVQHIENKQGPLERLFDLSTLELYTAGGSGGDLSVPGLIRHDAIAIRQHILERTQSDESNELS